MKRLVGTGSASTGADKRRQKEIDDLKAAKGGRDEFSNAGISQRNFSEEAKKGGPTAGDVAAAMGPGGLSMTYLPKEIRKREADYRNLELAAAASAAGLMADPSGSGMYVSAGGGKGRSQGSSMQSLLNSSPSTGENAWIRNRDFQRSLYEDRVKGQQQSSMALEASRREQELKLKMLQKLMSSMGGGSSSGEGYQETIFNNAGAPQIVKLHSKQPGQQSQILMQLLSGLR